MTHYNPASSTGPGVQLQMADGDSVTVASSVRIVSTNFIAIYDTGYGTAEIDGTVVGDYGLIFDGGSGGADIIEVGTTGLAQGSAAAIDGGFANSTVTNYGSIEGFQYGAGVLVDSQAGCTTNIDNFGTIAAQQDAIYAATSVYPGLTNVINSGTIEGGNRSIISNGILNVRNSGTIQGEVEFDGTSMVFDSSLGNVIGTIDASESTGNNEIVAGQSGGTVIGGAGDDEIHANQSQTSANEGAQFTLDGGGGTNALYGGGAYNTFLAGDAYGGFNQIHGGGSLMAGIAGYTNNTLSFANTPFFESVCVDLLKGHDAYVNSNATNTGVYSLEDAITNVPNIIGSSGADIIYADNGTDRITGGGGADQLYAGTGPSSQDTFVYTSYADSNLDTGYDTIVGFKEGTDKIDFSALHLSAANLAIFTSGTSNSVYLEQTPGVFNASTSLAISVDTTATGGLRASDFVF
jgi:Ca2+-binding RTX toxin-like protein